MKTLNPFVPTVPLISVPSRSRRERFKKAVFFVLAAHVALLLGLLLTDYHRDLVIYARELPKGSAPPAITPPEALLETASAASASRTYVTAPAKPSAPVTPSRAETSYTVQSGDTLNDIARRFGTTAKTIRTANGMATERLRVNQKLRIP